MSVLKTIYPKPFEWMEHVLNKRCGLFLRPLSALVSFRWWSVFRGGVLRWRKVRRIRAAGVETTKIKFRIFRAEAKLPRTNTTRTDPTECAN